MLPVQSFDVHMSAVPLQLVFLIALFHFSVSKHGYLLRPGDSGDL